MKRLSFVYSLSKSDFRPKSSLSQPRLFSSARPSLTRFSQKLPEILPVKLSPLKTRFYARQHFVRSSLDLFDRLSYQYNIPPEKFYLASKFYSACPEVSQSFTEKGFHVFHDQKPSYPGEYAQIRLQTVIKFWEEALKKDDLNSFEQCLIIDEGGLLTETIPGAFTSSKKVSVVEQTNGGLLSPASNHCLFPRVNVAQSAVKTFIEPILIADAVQQAVERWHRHDFHPKKNDVIGVIGMGAIGRIICETWLHKGYRVLWYDQAVVETETHPRLFQVSSLGDLVQNSSIIFGCTGKDCLKDEKTLLQQVPYDKLFISCSSEDREFHTLLRWAAEQGVVMSDPMGTVSLSNHRGKRLHLLNGGFPINFFRTPESVPSQDIALTRMLMLGGAIQATQISQSLSCDSVNQHQLVPLDPFVQRLAVRCWQPRPAIREKLPEGLLEKFEDIEWIQKHSGGNSPPVEKTTFSNKPTRVSLFRPVSNADATSPKSTACVDSLGSQLAGCRH